MAEELSYVIINPYTIYKSRTGGVLARLLTRTSLDLVGAQMFAPSQALIDEYAQMNPKVWGDVVRPMLSVISAITASGRSDCRPRWNAKKPMPTMTAR